MNGQHGGGTWTCSETLQNPSNTQSLSWSASSSGFPSNNSSVNFSQASGTLTPGQSTTVSFQVNIILGGSCYGVSQGNIIFTGPINTTNAPWICASPTFTVSPLNLNTQQSCQLNTTYNEWDCTVTITQTSQGQLILSVGGFSNNNVGTDTSTLMLTSPSDMVGQVLIYIPTTACPSTSAISYSADSGNITGNLTC